VLRAVERALYLEAFLYFIYNAVRLRKSKSARTKAQNEADNTSKDLNRTRRRVLALESSEVPEDALITFCSTMLPFAKQHSPVSPCHEILNEKDDSIAEVIGSILVQLRGAFYIVSRWEGEQKVEDIPHFYNYLRCVQTNRFGDAVVCEFLEGLITYAKNNPGWTVAVKIGKKDAAPEKITNEQYTEGLDEQAQLGSEKAQLIDATNEPQDLSLKVRAKDLKTRAEALNTYTIRLINLARNRRLFHGIDKCVAGNKIECSQCGQQSNNLESIVFMGRCGHAGCKECYDKCALSGPSRDHCVHKDCGATAPASATVEASDLATSFNTDKEREHGTKMVEIAKLVQSIPMEDKVLIFVQFERILNAVRQTLKAFGIGFSDTIHRSPEKQVGEFKTDRTKRALLLMLDSADAAGW
jgi:hypothetical protein